MFTGIAGFSKGIEQAYGDHYQYESSQSEPSDSESGRERSADLRGNGICATDDASLRRSEAVGFSEIDRDASAVLRYRFPTVRNYGNASAIVSADLSDFDLLCGGFPCQAFSIAGKRQGFADTRGTLFYEIARILADKRPAHFLLENVRGLVSHDNGKTIQRILGILADLDYFVEAPVLNSKDYGVPQNRERVFFVGHLRERCEREILSLGQSDGGDFKMLQRDRPLRGRGKSLGGCLRTRGVNQFDRVDLDNLVYPELMAIGGLQEHQHWRSDNVSPALTEAMGKGGGQTPLVTRQPLRYLNRNQKNVEGDYAFALDASQTSGLKVNTPRIRRLTPVECMRLQGFPDDWANLGDYDGKIKPLSDTAKYRLAGNAVTTTVIQALITRMLETGCLQPQ